MPLPLEVALPKASFFPKEKGAHEGRRQWRKQAVAVEAPKGWRGEDSAKRSAAPEYRASEAQAGTKTPVKQGTSQVRFANGGGPKGWSGEHTERSTVRSHGTPGKRSAVRCERSEATMLNCGTVARRSRDGGIDQLRRKGHPSVSFADSIPQFSMVVPLRSQARLRHSLLHWAYFALLRAQRARFVRPLWERGAFWLVVRQYEAALPKSLLFPEGKRGARRPSVAGSFSLAQQHLAIRANRSPLPTGRLPGR